VRENGEWLAGLDGAQYEISPLGDAALLDLWSAQQSLVRRVPRVAEESGERVVLDVSRLGYARHAQLEFVTGGAPRETRRGEREQFSRPCAESSRTIFPMKPSSRWRPPPICIAPFRAPIRVALSAAVRKHMLCLRLRPMKMPPRSTAF
jgi:hypothetical protein